MVPIHLNFNKYTCYDEAALATVGSCLLAGMLFSSVDSLQYIFFFFSNGIQSVR